MVLFGFADYDYACRNIPSLPTCNLWFRQMLNHPKGLTAPATAILGFPTDAAAFTQTLSQYGVGVNSACQIPRMAAAGGASGSLGNIANIIVCGLSVLIALALAIMAGRRVAAVGRVEMRFFLLMYALVQGFQLIDTGAILRAGSTPLIWLSGVHLGLVVGLFFVLAWLAFLSLQVVEDGTLFSILPLFVLTVILTVGSSYIFLDVGFTVTSYFQSSPPERLHSIWVFVLSCIWPGAAALFYFIVQMGVTVRVLKERKPTLLFFASAVAFILSQGAYYALSYKICTGTSRKVDGSFLATLLETISVLFLYWGWTSTTEASWDDFTVGSSSHLM